MNQSDNQVAKDQIKQNGQAKPADELSVQARNLEAVTEKAKSKIVSNLESLVPLTFVFLFFSVGVVAGYYAYTEYLRIPELDIRKEEKTQELQRVEAHANYLKGLSTLRDKLESNIKISEESITVKHEIPQLMNQVIQIATNALLKLESLVFAGSTTESTGTKTPGTINIQATVSGNFSQVVEFLKALENAGRVVTVKGLKYTAKSGTETPGITVSSTKFTPNIELNNGGYDLALTISGYYLGEVNAENLDYEILAQRQDPTYIVTKLESMTWYDPGSLNLQVGTSNPFSIDVENLDLQNATTQPVALPTGDESGFAQ